MRGAAGRGKRRPMGQAVGEVNRLPVCGSVRVRVGTLGPFAQRRVTVAPQSTERESMQRQIDIGIAEQDRARLSEGLSRLLADSYALYLKSQNFHWNVEGPRFSSLHEMFEVHYSELAPAIDEIAERIRSLGHYTPGGFGAFSKLTSVSEADDVPTANEMVAHLVDGHETVVRSARTLVETAEDIGDQATADLATQRLQVHEKTAWMLRASLERS